jgi:hypothetical protein
MKNLQQVLEFLIGIANQIIGLLIGLALVGFLWGVFKYIANGNNPEKRKEGSRFMIYGLISLLVITSFWGFIVLLRETFGFGVFHGQDDPLGPDNSGGFDIEDPSLAPPFEDIDGVFNDTNIQIPT